MRPGVLMCGQSGSGRTAHALQHPHGHQKPGGRVADLLVCGQAARDHGGDGHEGDGPLEGHRRAPPVPNPAQHQ